MKINRHKEIYWGELYGASLGNIRANSFLFGSIVRYYQRDHVYFENKMVASGTFIHEWYSSLNFQGSRLTPSLPLLKKGATYRFDSRMEVRPQQGIYFRLIFLDRYNKEVSTVVEKKGSFSFEFPKDAYHYKVQLLSAGVESFDFHWISIEEE